MKNAVLLMLLLMLGSVALAQIITTPENVNIGTPLVAGGPTVFAVPSPDENLTGVLDFLTKAFQGGDWFAVGAVVVMLAVWASSRFVKDAKWLPLISAGYGMMFSLVLSIVETRGLPWWVALYKGLITSGGAAIFWSMLGKRVLPSLVKDADEAGTLDEKDGPIAGA